MDSLVLFVSSATLALSTWILREIVRLGRDLVASTERISALDRRLTRLEDRIE